MTALAELDVLFVDCQATLAAPGGQLLEIGWARTGAQPLAPQSRLVSLPEGEHVPRVVERITGISDRLLEGAASPERVWDELSADASTIPQQPTPTVAHFARFERPFLAQLAGGAPPLDIACTHEIAVRLFPELPRRSLRALAGYFGRAVGPLRRSAEHVEATAFVWTHLVGLLGEHGVRTWPELQAWLAQPLQPPTAPRRKRGWPMPRELRLALPDRPGIYRMLRTSGDVLYVGKATSLHRRVNSYFRKQQGAAERTLEMLSQARGLSFELAASPLEAALLEPDEIKRHRPPYNEALTEDGRAVWFASRDLTERSMSASGSCLVGPIPSAALLERLASLANGSTDALGRGPWAPPALVLDAGRRALREAHREIAVDIDARGILRLGARLWREGRSLTRADDDVGGEEESATAEWTPELVMAELERLAMLGALAARRGRWLTALVESTVVWSEPSADGPRMLTVRGGEIAHLAGVPAGTEPPVPAGHARAREDRHAGFDVARFDRLRVLTTELKRLAAKGYSAAVRLGTGPALQGARLARVLGRV